MNRQRDLLDTVEAARYVGLAARTLIRWRGEGSGPTFLKLGGAVRYEMPELDRWINAQRRRSTSDAGDVSRASGAA